MLKRSITYTDFNDQSVTEVFYFNLSKPELIELAVGPNGGLAESIQRIIEAQNGPGLLQEFKRIILSAYGVKSEDGKRFIKSDQLREEFAQTAAYAELFMELTSSDAKATEFFNGLLPKDMLAEIEAENAKKAAAAIPTSVPAPTPFQQMQQVAATPPLLPPTPPTA